MISQEEGLNSRSWEQCLEVVLNFSLLRPSYVRLLAALGGEEKLCIAPCFADKA